jgi:hypothetical protein
MKGFGACGSRTGLTNRAPRDSYDNSLEWPLLEIEHGPMAFSGALRPCRLPI